MGVRTSYDIPNFRVGSQDVYEFKSGLELEQFMFGYHSDPEKFVRVPRNQRLPYWYLFRLAVVEAIRLGRNYQGMLELPEPCFAPILYREVKASLHRREAELLQMYAVVGSRLDYDYGVDCIFILDNAVVTLDATLNPFNKRKFHPHELIYSPYDLSGRRTTKFAQQIADNLRSPEAHLYLLRQIKYDISDAINRARR